MSLEPKKCRKHGYVMHHNGACQMCVRIDELSTEYALLKGLDDKDYEQLKRLRELEALMNPST